MMQTTEYQSTVKLADTQPFCRVFGKGKDQIVAMIEIIDIKEKPYAQVTFIWRSIRDPRVKVTIVSKTKKVLAAVDGFNTATEKRLQKFREVTEGL